MTLPIIYCMMCRDRLYEVSKCLDLVGPYVDNMVIIDGGSVDDSIFYLRNRSDVHMFLHPWKDHFSNQRNNYVKRAWEVNGNKPFYALISDPDEFYSVEALSHLSEITSMMESRNLNLCAFQCISQTLKGDQVVWSNIDNYFKGLLFLVDDINTCFYSGNPHETLNLTGGRREMRTELKYYHKKQENIIWQRGCRNMYIGGGGPNLNNANKLWVELKSIVKDVYSKDLSWNEYEKELMVGNLDQRLKDWMIKVRKENGWDGSSEHREAYKYYFRILHPEEEPEDIRGENIP